MQSEQAVHFESPITRCSLLRSLPPAILEHLVSSRATYRKKERLFIEGQQSRGVFVLCSGKAKLSTCSTLGKTIITRLAGSGDVLGLNAVVSGRPYGATAEMMTAGKVDYIPRHFLLRLIKEHKGFAMAFAEELSACYYPVHDVLRLLGLASHPIERLAKLLLSWTSRHHDDGANPGDHTFKLPLTHQEIADSIGSTRETVSKLFSELKRRHLLRAENGELEILNRLELEQIVQF